MLGHFGSKDELCGLSAQWGVIFKEVIKGDMRTWQWRTPGDIITSEMDKDKCMLTNTRKRAYAQLLELLLVAKFMPKYGKFENDLYLTNRC